MCLQCRQVFTTYEIDSADLQTLETDNLIFEVYSSGE